MSHEPSRRDWLLGAPAVLGAGVLATPPAAAQVVSKHEPFLLCLNTSTIRGQKVPVAQEVDLAAKVGYQAIEPWINELDQFVKEGGNLKDLGKRIRDAGLVVPSAIGFPEWIVDDDARRTKGLEEARRAMDMVQQIGGTRLAAPPVGATKQSGMSLLKIAERFHALVDIGARLGVIPQVELWGFSQTLGRLGETAFVAVECGHPKACVLADVYHLHKGGSGFTGLHLLSAEALQVFHMNDYPADPPPATLTDAHRVYPGDGVAPLKEMLRTLRRSGFRGVLSLELFNRDYWKQDPTLVARTGLEKLRAVVRGSLE